MGSYLSNTTFMQYVPFAASHHQTQPRSLGCPETAPFAWNFTVLGDDVVNVPGGIEDMLELSPVLRQVLGASNWLEFFRQEVVNDIRIKNAEELLDVAGIAAAELL